jgi:hypothetical protein
MTVLTASPSPDGDHRTKFRIQAQASEIVRGTRGRLASNPVIKNVRWRGWFLRGRPGGNREPATFHEPVG